MNEDIRKLIELLSSRSIMERKLAVKQLSCYLNKPDAYLARISLQYVSEHDPAYTVRNLARQAFHAVGELPRLTVWEKTYGV